MARWNPGRDWSAPAWARDEWRRPTERTERHVDPRRELGEAVDAWQVEAPVRRCDGACRELSRLQAHVARRFWSRPRDVGGRDQDAGVLRLYTQGPAALYFPDVAGRVPAPNRGGNAGGESARRSRNGANFSVGSPPCPAVFREHREFSSVRMLGSEHGSVVGGVDHG